MSIKNTTKSTCLPSNKRLKRFVGAIGLAGLVTIAGCGHMDVPSTTHSRSGVTDKPADLGYDHIQYENTSAFELPADNLYARLPTVQAYLSESGGNNHVGSKSGGHNANLPGYIIIEASDLDRWRYAKVDAPKGNRTYYAPPMRLPVSKSLPVGKYITVRPITNLWGSKENRQNKQPSAYVFKVVASAEAKQNSGNFLTLISTVSGTKDSDWVVPLSYLNQPQKSVSSVMEETPPTVITFAPGIFYGATSQIAVIKGGLNQGLSYGDNLIVVPGRLKDIHVRAVRDGRDIRPEGIARVRIIQATSDYSLAEITSSAQPVSEGDILVFQHGGKSK